MRTQYLKYKRLVLRLSNALVIVLGSFYWLYTNKALSSQISIISYIEASGLSILLLLLLISFRESLYVLYEDIIIVCIWLFTFIIIADAILSGFNQAEIFLTILLLVIAYQSILSVKNFYKVTMILLSISTILFILSGSNYQFILPTGLVYILVAGVYFLNIYQKEKMINAYNKLQDSQYELINNVDEGFALHELIYDNDNIPIDYRFLTINNAFQDLTGLQKNNVIGHRVYELLPETEPYWLETYSNVVIKQEKCNFINYSKELDKYFKVSAYPAGEHKFATLFTDITNKLMHDRELNLAMKKEKQASAFKGQFLRDVNHKLRTPLNGMMGMAQLIDFSMISDDNKELIEAMINEMNRSRNILNQIAEYAEIEDLDYVISEVDIEALIYSIAEEMLLIGPCNIQLINHGCQLKGVFFEQQVASKVLKALLYNALKHSKSELVEIHFHPLKEENNLTNYYNICVKDFGIGIEPYQQEYIFNELHHHDFVNLSRDESNVSLPICKRLIKEIGGNLYLRANSDGQKGVTFTIKMPIFDRVGHK